MEPDISLSLTPRERGLLEWILPEDRPGYRKVRELLDQWTVAARGVWGPGHCILVPPGRSADLGAPLLQVLAFGVVETTVGTITVTVREPDRERLDCEVTDLRESEDGVQIKELRRWTYSTWLPGLPCPACGGSLREVPMRTTGGMPLSLAFCVHDERLWVHSGRTLVNHPLPVTNFYNELMLQTRTRDPRIALAPRFLFERLATYSDRDLTAAFRSYNQIRPKVLLSEPLEVPLPASRTVLARIIRLLRRSGAHSKDPS